MERVFASVRTALPPDCETAVVHCPTPAHGPLWLFRGLYNAWRSRAEINHIVGDIHYAALVLPRARTIVTVLDALHLEQLHGLRRLLFRWLYFSWPLRRCGRIVTISAATKDHLIRLFPSLATRIQVIHCCYLPDFVHHPRPFPESCPVILHIGTRAPKNLNRLVEALHGIPCVLKIIGPLSADQTALLSRHEINFCNYVNLSDGEMLQTYIDSDLVVFVSLAEGFGMPIIEAQAMGRALVVSEIEPMTGVAGEGACLVDPLNVADIRRGILSMIQDHDRRERVIACGLINARRFAPESIASLYAALYREVAASARTS